MIKKVFVTGIGTGIGKTHVAAMLVKLWNADYWKPIQSGDLQPSDSMQVAELVDQQVKIFPERYKLTAPLSPHASAALDSLTIQLSDFSLPDTDRSLIVEGAGGLYVPINDEDFIIDLIVYLNLSVVLVLQDYLGCINHTMLSIEALVSKGIPVDSVVFNGEFSEATSSIIRKHLPAGVECLVNPWQNKEV
ncbi:dethiobiotin synthase [Sphingobacterium sp. DK4209]|uniref:ATP-dependent dethiobiotin synthetase BioD n=1 Tax=Sphingobacterium zhuxiongii TaxID=2662364 RepID=A0A5Q0QD32_9SPHI|nr:MULTISPECIES: dethiobiotin synthase [unclassified Sphingobacterium]MVZ66639.1 dethiobiotin synthase [Sphingobacterium sp. DK4209]QGA26821.1 dethiobiotin synthase [Sphingobacterium sp. dk4302]